MDKRFLAKILADTTDFTRGIAKCIAMVEELDDSKKINIEADVAAATAQIARANKELRSIPNEIRTRLNLNSDAVLKVTRYNQTLRTVPNKVTTNLDIDAGKAVAEATAFKAVLGTIPDKKEVKLGIDKDAMLQAALAATLLKRNLMSMASGVGPKLQEAGKGIHTMQAALMALVPAIIPIVATAVPAVMALGNAIAVAGGGVLGLAGTFAIAGAGVAAFGAMAVTAYKMLDSGAIQATAQTNAFKTALASLQTQWQTLVSSNASSIFQTMTNGINIAKTALSGLTPFINGVAASMATLSGKLLSFFQNSSIANNFFAMFNTIGVQVFTNVLNAAGRFGAGLMAIFTQFGPLFSWMAQGLANMAAQFQAWATSVGASNGIKDFISYVQTNLPLIGQIFGNTFTGIFNLFKAFGTNSQTIFQSLAQMSAQFAQWSATVAQSQGFKQFIDYVQTQGPVVMSTIGNIVTAVIAFATAMAPVGAAVLSTVSAIAQWVASFAQAHPQITAVVGSIATLGLGFMKLLSFISPLLPSFSTLSTAFGLIRTALTTILGPIMQFGTFIVQLVSKLNLVANVVRIASMAFALLTSPIGLAIAAFVAIGAAIYLLWTRCETFRNGVMVLVGVMQTLGSAIMSGLGTALSFIGQQLTMVVARVVAFGAQLVSGIGSAMSALGSAISSGISAVVNFFATGFQTMLSIASSIMSSISSAISSAWSAISSAVSSAISAVVSFVSSGFQNMLSVASSIMSSISSAISSAWSAITSAISSAISTVVSVISSGFSNMLSTIVSFGSSIVSTITSAMSQFVSAISSGASQAISAVSNMISDILGKIKGAAGDMVSAGADLVRGFINGIQKMAGEAVAAAGRMASDAVAKVKSFLKIGSPSKVLKQIGEWLTEGFAIGIEKKIPKVQTAIDRMLRPVRKGLAALRGNDYSAAKDGANSVYSLIIENMNNATKKIEEIADKKKQLSKKIAEVNKSLYSSKNWKTRVTKSKELSKLKAQFASLTKQAKKAYKTRKVNRDLKYEIRPMLIYMTRIAKKREEMAVKLDKAKEKLQAAIDKKTDFRKSIKDDLQGYASIMSTGRKTSQGMVKIMSKRLTDIKKYQATIGSLAKMGLNKTTLKEILDAGIEQGSVIAKGLFKGGKEAVAQVNSLQAQINKASSSMADANADRFYQAGVNAAKGIVKGLQSQDKMLKAVATKIAGTIERTIKARLKIHSPSRLMIELMRYVGLGLANGLSSMTNKVASAASGLSGAIEKNIVPDVALPDMSVAGQVDSLQQSLTSDLNSSITQDGETGQNITIIMRTDHDLQTLTTQIEQVQGLKANTRLMTQRRA